jgi:hypothetical protein
MEETATIHRIAARAIKMYDELGLFKNEKDKRFAEVGIAHELEIVHDNVYRLRLDELLVAKDFDFAHDVAGIHRHLDRKGRHLRDCFVPRYAAAA